MQTIDQTAPAIAAVAANAVASTVPASTAAPVANAKPVPRKRAAKPAVASKPAKPAKAATAAKPAKPANDADATRSLSRAAAAIAVRDYYRGASLPFKAAADRFADLRTDKQAKRPTTRQAALLATMLAADLAGNIKRDGTFKRGGFVLPAKLVNPSAPDGATVQCQPETGCLSDMLGRTVSYVSGPTSGREQRETVLRINLKRAHLEISEHLGGKLASAALAKLAALGVKAA